MPRDPADTWRHERLDGLSLCLVRLGACRGRGVTARRGLQRLGGIARRRLYRLGVTAFGGGLLHVPGLLFELGRVGIGGL